MVQAHERIEVLCITRDRKQRITSICIAKKAQIKGGTYGIFNSAVGVLQTLVIALGAGLGIWGVINLMEGYGNDNPGYNAHVR